MASISDIEDIHRWYGATNNTTDIDLLQLIPLSIFAPVDPLENLIQQFEDLEIDGMNRHKLSKSTFTYGVQCLKRLYLNKHHRRLKIDKDPLDATTRQLFESGRQVGVVARSLFPGGIDCSPPTPYDYRPSVMKTWADMRNPSTRVIYEAAFMASDVLAALDILVKCEGEAGVDMWDAYEVKSATKVNDALKLDAALQYWVLTNSGVKLRSMNLVTINSSYVWTDGDQPDVNQLFTISNVTEKCISDMGFIEKYIEVEKRTIDAPDVPDVKISSHCSKPYKCDFMGHCWKQAQVPDYSILDLARGGEKAWGMFNAGWRTTRDVQNGDDLTPNQLVQVYADISNDVLIDRGTLKEFINSVTYPIYFLDFETISSPLPLFKKTKPYQHLPFQYSLHIQRGEEVSDSSITHASFLAEGTLEKDPRLGFLNSLLGVIGTSGSIVVYSAFEQNILEGIARDFPEFEEPIKAILSRIVDMMQPFAAKAYYTAAMQGSYSIKKVLPALVPECASSYKQLAIADGGSASSLFLQMMQGKYSEDVEKARDNLEEYCKLDTWAMVKVFEKVKEAANSTSPIASPSIVFGTATPIPGQVVDHSPDPAEVATPRKTKGKKKAAMSAVSSSDASLDTSAAPIESAGSPDEAVTPKKRTPRKKKSTSPTETTDPYLASEVVLNSIDPASTTDLATPLKPAKKNRVKTTSPSPLSASAATTPTLAEQNKPIEPVKDSGERFVNVYELIPRPKKKSPALSNEDFDGLKLS